MTITVNNPYPCSNCRKKEIKCIKYETDLILRRKNNPIYRKTVLNPHNRKKIKTVEAKAIAIVQKPYKISYYLGDKPKRRKIKIPAGFITDGTSIPSYGFFKWIARMLGITRWGDGLEASVIHDYLYVAWQFQKNKKKRKPRQQDKDFADRLFYTALLELGISRWKAWLMYKASSWFGKDTYDGKNPNTWCKRAKAICKCGCANTNARDGCGCDDACDKCGCDDACGGCGCDDANACRRCGCDDANARGGCGSGCKHTEQ